MLTNKRGEILAVTMGLSIIFILLGYYAIYFSTVKRETFEKENMRTRAFWIAEAGRVAAKAELDYILMNGGRLQVLLDAAGFNTNQTNFTNYFTAQNPLGLFQNYPVFPNPTITPRVSVSQQFANPQLLTLGSYTSAVNSYNTLLTITPTNPLPVGVTQNPTYLDPFTYTFYFTYTIASIGSTDALGLFNKQVEATGNFTLTIQPNSFARYALFTNFHTDRVGDIVWFTRDTKFYGPVHTNTAFGFAENPSGYFTDLVTQVGQNAYFFNNGAYISLDADKNGNIDVPVFEQGFQRGKNRIDLPSSQTQQSEKQEALGGMLEPTSDGIYLGQSNPNPNAPITGGIYIKGSSQQIIMGKDANENPVYTITSAAGCTRNLTINYAGGGTTKITNISGNCSAGTPAGIYQGIPDGISQAGGVLIYDQGGINSFSGTVQKDTAVTVAAENNVVIDNHITYEKDPRIAPGYRNILGVLSWQNDIVISSVAPADLKIHGILMSVVGQTYVSGYDVIPAKGDVHLLGGLITNVYGCFGTFYFSFTGYGRDFVYDRRVTQGIKPPYFPYASTFITTQDGLFNKPQWKEK